jgi:hypothetical protein
MPSLATAGEWRPADAGQAEASASRTEWTAALSQRISGLLAVLMWILIFLHPVALIALSFHWGLL